MHTLLLAAAVAAVATAPASDRPLDRTDLRAAQPDSRITLRINGSDVPGTVARRTERSADRVVLSGRLDGVTGGSFTIAFNGEVVRGGIRSAVFGLQRIVGAPGAVIIEPVDPASIPDCDHFTDLPGGPADPGALKGDAAAGGLAGEELCDDGSVIDVLVVFTNQAAASAGGIAAMEAMIDMAVEDTNVALVNSDVQTSFHLVHTRMLEVDDPELVDLSTLTTPGDGILDEVHPLREAFGADQVVLIEPGGGGVANGLFTLEPDQADNAYCIVRLNSLLNLVFAHELGHQLGCCHAFLDGGGCPEEGGLLYSFSNGWRYDGDSGTLWRTIMAYNPGTRIDHFASPEVTFDGQPTGQPEGSFPVGADNAETIRLAKLAVSNWRCNDGICEALVLPSDAPDCDGDGLPDACAIALGAVDDTNGNGVPDVCELGADLDGDGVVGGADLGLLLSGWGACDGCAEDLDGDGVVGGGDLGILLAAWGAAG